MHCASKPIGYWAFELCVNQNATQVSPYPNSNPNPNPDPDPDPNPSPNPNPNPNLRQAAIDRFCRAGSDTFVFLLSTRAGGRAAWPKWPAWRAAANTAAHRSRGPLARSGP